MKYEYYPDLPLGFLINNPSNSVWKIVITSSREKPEKPIKLLRQVEIKQERSLFTKQKISAIALYVEFYLNIESLDLFFKVLFVLLKRNWKPTDECL